MSQPSLKEKIGDEQLLSTALAVEPEVAKKTSAQRKLEKPKPTHSGPFSLNVDYYIEKLFKEMGSIESQLQKLETEEHFLGWNF